MAGKCSRKTFLLAGTMAISIRARLAAVNFNQELINQPKLGTLEIRIAKNIPLNILTP